MEFLHQWYNISLKVDTNLRRNGQYSRAKGNDDEDDDDDDDEEIDGRNHCVQIVVELCLYIDLIDKH